MIGSERFQKCDVIKERPFQLLSESLSENVCWNASSFQYHLQQLQYPRVAGVHRAGRLVGGDLLLHPGGGGHHGGGQESHQGWDHCGWDSSSSSGLISGDIWDWLIKVGRQFRFDVSQCKLLRP